MAEVLDWAIPESCQPQRPAHVGTFEEEEEIDLDAAKMEINTLEPELTEVRAKTSD